MAGKVFDIPIPTSVATGVAVPVPPYDGSLTVYLELVGAAAMTVQFEFSGDGVIWNSLGAALSADGFNTLGLGTKVAFVRADTTVFTVLGGGAIGRLVI